MSDAEKQYLSSLISEPFECPKLSSTLKWIGLWSVGLVVCVLLAAGLVALEPHPITLGLTGSIIVIAALICIFALIVLIGGHLRWRRYHRAFMRDTIPRIQEAIDDGRVEVKRVSASRVIEVVEFEDEGPGYIFEVSDDQILVLKGQEYFPVDDEMDWPNSAFEIVRGTTGGLWIGIFCSGEKLDPDRVIDGAHCTEEFAWPHHEDVLVGTPDAYVETIVKHTRCSRVMFILA